MSALGIKSSDTLRLSILHFFQLLFAAKIDEFCLVRVHLKAHGVHPRLNLKHTVLKGYVVSASSLLESAMKVPLTL